MDGTILFVGGNCTEERRIRHLEIETGLTLIPCRHECAVEYLRQHLDRTRMIVVLCNDERKADDVAFIIKAHRESFSGIIVGAADSPLARSKMMAAGASVVRDLEAADYSVIGLSRSQRAAMQKIKDDHERESDDGLYELLIVEVENALDLLWRQGGKEFNFETALHIIAGK